MIHDLLPFFNKSGPIYRDLIGDEERPEFPVIANVNDINKGAMQNALEWHQRFQKRAILELNVRKSTGIFLRIWEKIFGVQRLVGMTDEDYADYIVRRIMSSGSAVPQVFAALPDAVFEKYPPRRMGAFTDLCYADVGPVRPSGNYHASSVVTWQSGTVFCVVRSADVLTMGLKARLQAALAAGSAIYVAIIP